jgi:hypothetical protein
VAIVRIRKLWKDSGSGVTNCPALYEADGGYVVQGLVLDDETRDQLDQLGSNEAAVWVPANVLDRLRGDG